MANPLVELFYEAGGPLRFREVERTLSQCGLSLTRPGDGAVIRSSEIGEPIPSSAEEIAERAQRREWIAANFWVDEANAAHVSLWPLDDTCICESILMDTLDDSFQIAITNATVGRFRSMSGRRMVVVDLFGDSHEYVDWNAFFSDPNQPLHGAIPTQYRLPFWV